MQYKIHHSGKGHDYTEDEIAIVVEAMRQADPLTQGKYRNEFEAKFSQYHGVKYSFALNNATCALVLAAQLCQFEEGDELIAPTLTFTSSVYPFIKKGAKIVWADIDFTTRVLTAETIEPHITPRTKAILVVNLYGYLTDMPSIMALAKKHNILVVEDNAQAMGTDLNGQKAGTFADLGVFSFHSHKNISTLGEGGMLVVKDERMAKLVPMLRHNGHTTFDFEREHYWLPAMGNLDMPELNGKMMLPSNFCIGEIECALGAKLLDRLDQMNAEKRKRAIYFIDSLKKFEEIEFHRVDSTRHNYHLLVAYLKDDKRNRFFEKMAYEHKIQVIAPYYPLYRYEMYKKLGYGTANCPATDRFWDNMVSFPFHHWLSDSDFEYMLESTKKSLETLR